MSSLGAVSLRQASRARYFPEVLPDEPPSKATHASSISGTPWATGTTDTLKGNAPKVQFTVNWRQYNTGYYLADGIYPESAVFVRTITFPHTDKDKLFAKSQEGARKEVERAFGALQKRFNIVRRPARLWRRSSVRHIMLACVILHDMIVEDERGMIHVPLDLNKDPRTSFALPPKVQIGPHVSFADYLRRSSSIRDRPTHIQLKSDLVENIWERFGDD